MCIQSLSSNSITSLSMCRSSAAAQWLSITMHSRTFRFCFQRDETFHRISALRRKCLQSTEYLSCCSHVIDAWRNDAVNLFVSRIWNIREVAERTFHSQWLCHHRYHHQLSVATVCHCLFTFTYVKLVSFKWKICVKNGCTLHPRYNALQCNADSVITQLRSWTPIFQVGLVSG